MDINLINAQDNLFRLSKAGKRIIEYCRDSKNKYLIHIYAFDPERNEVNEITPERHKIDFISIQNGIWQCRDIYYASFEMMDEEQIMITIFRYRPERKEEQQVISFVRALDAISGNTRIKVFILSETALLVQTEVRKNNASENMMGNIAFSLTLYNLESREEIPVTDSNFINNGIHSVIPVSDKKIMVKTGYSYLEDKRLGTQAGHASLIEGVFAATVAKFIADITISADSVDMPLIESAYENRFITAPDVTGKYIHFTVADEIRRTTKCIFYNHETEERLEYSLNSFDPEDMYITYVIGDVPYVRMSTGQETGFINLQKAAADIVFYDELFLDQMGRAFILAPRSDPRRIHIYAYPRLKQCFNEKTKYLRSITLQDTHYVYIND